VAYLTISNSIWAIKNFGLNAQAGSLLKRLSVTRIGFEWILATPVIAIRLAEDISPKRVNVFILRRTTALDG
jgi:hypothetical protein